jgi:hypothetical protein
MGFVPFLDEKSFSSSGFPLNECNATAAEAKAAVFKKFLRFVILIGLVLDVSILNYKYNGSPLNKKTCTIICAGLDFLFCKN